MGKMFELGGEERLARDGGKGVGENGEGQEQLRELERE